MAEPMRSRRRIEHLKQLAYDCNLTNEQARQHGKLTATATWEKLLTLHGLEFDRKIEITSNTTEIASQESKHSINFFEWVDFGQALALAMASVGLAVMILGLFPRYASLPQVKITIQVGK